MTPRQKQKNGTYQKRCYLASTILVDFAFWRLTLCVVWHNEFQNWTSTCIYQISDNFYYKNVYQKGFDML